VEDSDVKNLIVIKKQHHRHINAVDMEEAFDVPTVLIGLIQGVVHLYTMVIVRLASNTCSQMTLEA
jgi:hypothetical protein